MPVLRQYLEERLNKADVPMTVADRYEGVTGRGLAVVDREGTRRVLEASTVIFTGEYQGNLTLRDELVAAGFDTRVIGDCAQPYGILEAIDSGARLGREL